MAWKSFFINFLRLGRRRRRPGGAVSDPEALDTILDALAPYRIRKKEIVLTGTILGRGGFGVVKLAEMRQSGTSGKRRSGTLVAVKELHPTGTKEKNTVVALALVKELQVWADLAHPHVVRLVGFYLDSSLETAWLISPYMKNGNIRDYLNLHKPGMAVRLRMWRDVARGVAYLHRRNRCHGDIKGANILVDDAGQPKLCDFGLTRLVETGAVGDTTLAALKGTTRYMAPELFHEGEPALSMKSDVWAWSCLGLEMLFDLAPYHDMTVDMAIPARIMQGDPPLDLNYFDVDDGIKLLFKDCWVANPQKRVTIKQCVDAVGGALDNRRNVEPDKQASPPRRKDRLRRRTLAAPSMAQNEEIANPAGQNEAIDLLRLALQHQPEDHPERHISLHSLAISLLDKYANDGDVAALNEAIDLNQQVLELRPEGHPLRHESLYNLSFAHWIRYDEEGRFTDLLECIDIDRQVLVLRPEGHPERHTSLHSLGVTLRDKYAQDGDVAALNEAIALHRQALQLRPDGHTERQKSLRSLTMALENRFDRERRTADLSEAIALNRQALGYLTELHPQHQSIQASLDRLLAIRRRNRYRKWYPQNIFVRMKFWWQRPTTGNRDTET